MRQSNALKTNFADRGRDGCSTDLGRRSRRVFHPGRSGIPVRRPSLETKIQGDSLINYLNYRQLNKVHPINGDKGESSTGEAKWWNRSLLPISKVQEKFFEG